MRTVEKTERRWDVGVAHSLDIVGMPLLQSQLAAMSSRNLDATHIVYVNHAISDGLMVARAFCRLGAEVTSVLIPYRSRQEGQTQQAVQEAFRFIGTTFTPQPQHPLQFNRAMAADVSRAIQRAGMSGCRWMIVEDGGYAFPMLHDDPELRPYLASCLGAVEHTTRGRLNYEFVEMDRVPRTPRVLRRPAVTIASSWLKTTHEAAFVAQGLMDECNWLLRRDHQFLRYRSATVVGYGKVGAALARALSRHDVDVMVVDPAISVACPGHTLTTLSEAIRRGTFLVFGATGMPSMTIEDLTVWLREPAHATLYLASASSKNVEFAHILSFLDRAEANPDLLRSVSGREGALTRQRDPQVGIRYMLDFVDGTTKTCVLMADGYPVIFFPPDTHGAPNRAMDPVMTQLFLAACMLPHACAALSTRVHSLDDLRALTLPKVPPGWNVLIDEEGLLRQWCALNDIDPRSYFRRTGFLTRGDPDVKPGTRSVSNCIANR